MRRYLKEAYRVRRTSLWLMLAVLLAALAAPAARAGSADLQVTVNGQKLALDPAPFIENGRTLVPLRAIFEVLGATIQWNGETRTVTGRRGPRTVELTVDSDLARVNGAEVRLAVPAMIRASRTFVPLRFVAEALGAAVDFDGETRTVIVVDLDYAGAGPATALLQQMAIFRGAPDGDFRATFAVGPAAGPRERGMEAVIAGQVRGADAYFRADQTIAYMGYNIQQASELAARSGQVYVKGAGETAWQALGPGTARLDRLGLPGGFDPSRPFSTPLIGGIQAVTAGPKATVGGEEYQEFSLTFDPARLQRYFGELAAAFGTSLEGIAWESLQGTVQVRTRDGFTRKLEIRFRYRIAGPDGAQVPWQLSLTGEWQPGAGATAWPAGLPE